MHIKLFEKLAVDTLRHRDSAKKIVELASGTSEEVIIDFSGIIFASRSFCNELRRSLEDMNVKYVNMTDDVDEMMQLSRVKPKTNIDASFNHKKLELVTS